MDTNNNSMTKIIGVKSLNLILVSLKRTISNYHLIYIILNSNWGLKKLSNNISLQNLTKDHILIVKEVIF
jgi:hypothetical protein